MVIENKDKSPKKKEKKKAPNMMDQNTNVQTVCGLHCKIT